MRTFSLSHTVFNLIFYFMLRFVVVMILRAKALKHIVWMGHSPYWSSVRFRFFNDNDECAPSTQHSYHLFRTHHLSRRVNVVFGYRALFFVLSRSRSLSISPTASRVLHSQSCIFARGLCRSAHTHIQRYIWS